MLVKSSFHVDPHEMFSFHDSVADATDSGHREHLGRSRYVELRSLAPGVLPGLLHWWFVFLSISLHLVRPGPILLLALDLFGVFVFGLSGAAVAMRERLDFIGVLVLSLVTGLAGGIIRDVLIGAVPPDGIKDWRYLTVALGSGTFAYFVSGHLPKLKMTIVVLDAAGLGLFAVSGAEKALSFHLNPLASILLGVVTGAGGGIIRDVLVAKIPRVLQVEIYASAALVGAAVAVLGHVLGVAAIISSVAGVLVCFVIRVVSVSRGWTMPARRSD